MPTAGWTSFEPQDFHATAAVAHAKTAVDHAHSAVKENADAYLHHMNASMAHEAAAKAHLTAHQHLPLPDLASPTDEGTPIPTEHAKISTPVTSNKISVPKHGQKV